jgi:hypothetical protein
MKRILLFSLSAVMATLIFSSYATGPFFKGAGNRTGSAGSLASCSGSGCHASNNANTICSLVVQTSTGTPITQYTPGTSYTVQIGGFAGSAFTNFGFQASCVRAAATSTQAGNFTAYTNMHVSNFGSLQLVEHSTPLSGTTVTGGNAYLASFTWTAPAAGTGDVKFFAMLNAVNNNTKETGDQPGTPITLTLKEASSTSVATVPALQISAYPNPASDVLHLRLNASGGSCRVAVFNLTGSVVTRHSVEITNGEASIATAQLVPGYYVLKIEADEQLGAVSFVKQ